MPRIKQFDEQQALEQAMELFWEKGFHATSMQDLVSRLGINRASLYDTFGGKQALFDRALALYRQKNQSGAREFVRPFASVREGLTALFDQAIEEAACDLEQKGCFIVNTTTELVPGDPSLQSLLLDNQAQFEEFFWSYLKEGQERGEIASDKDVENIAHLLYTLYNGLRVVSKVKTDAPKLKRMIALSLQLLD